MAILIPALATCLARMTPGQRRLAALLERKLDAHCLLWYGVPVGPRPPSPDFVLLHPRGGLVLLQAQDWTLAQIGQATAQAWEITLDGRTTVAMNPLAQARFCALQATALLQRDAQLLHAQGPHPGALALRWGYGVVLTGITRREFEAAGLAGALTPQRVLCQDEMAPEAPAADFQRRLWAMAAGTPGGPALSPAQLKRVRWHLFAQARIERPGAAFDDRDPAARLPAALPVMGLRQEHLARSLGAGHRVIHGAAGSGKTMILLQHAQALAQGSAPGAKPVLVLCHHEPLACTLAAQLRALGVADAAAPARHFHRWCEEQLRAHGLALPPPGLGPLARRDETIVRVIHAVARGAIATGQYHAVLIDEAHNFAPEWLALLARMVDAASNRLLLLCDDAQSVYGRALTRRFSFDDVGIQAAGRSTLLRTNYRSTRPIFETARLIGAELLAGEAGADGGIPRVAPLHCGREGPAPLVVRLPSLRAEAIKVAAVLHAARGEGLAWGAMAVVCRRPEDLDECAKALARLKLPHAVRRGPGHFAADEDSIKVLTMHACRGLEFALVALVGVGQMPLPGEDRHEEARLFYSAATRAAQRLVVTLSGPGEFGQRLAPEAAPAPAAPSAAKALLIQ